MYVCMYHFECSPSRRIVSPSLTHSLTIFLPCSLIVSLCRLILEHLPAILACPRPAAIPSSSAPSSSSSPSPFSPPSSSSSSVVTVPGQFSDFPLGDLSSNLAIQFTKAKQVTFYSLHIQTIITYIHQACLAKWHTHTYTPLLP